MFLFDFCVSFFHFMTTHMSFSSMVPELPNRISASCRSLEPQFNTSRILECCHKLGEAGEYQSDVLLVQLVRLQEIRYRMGRSFPYDESYASRKPDAPIEMFVRAWQKELETFWASLPAEFRQNSKPLYKPSEAHRLIACLLKGFYSQPTIQSKSLFTRLT